MNNRQGMQARALGMLDPQIGAWVRAKRKKLKRIYRTIPLRPLNEDEANQLAMKLFECNADEARKMLFDS